MRPTVSPRPHAIPAPGATDSTTSQRFGAHHLLDWCAAGSLLAVPVATGIDIWAQVGWASDTGRLIFLGLALVGLACAALYYIARIAVGVLVTPEGIAAVRGPWRHELRWREIARLLERTETADRRPVRWLVAETHDGRRLRINEDLVADYPALRAAMHAARQRWRALDAAGADQSGTYGPLYIAQERHAPIGGALGVAGGALATAVYLWALVTSLRVLALVVGVAALGLGAWGLWVWLRRRSFALDDDGVEAWSRFPIVRLEWRDVARVERSRVQVRPLARAVLRAAGWAGEWLRGRIAGQWDWIDGKPWPRRLPDRLMLRGGGRRLTLALHHLRDPEAALARVERGLQLARWQRAPSVAETAPADAMAGLPEPTAASEAAMERSTAVAHGLAEGEPEANEAARDAGAPASPTDVSDEGQVEMGAEAAPAASTDDAGEDGVGAGEDAHPDVS